MQIAKVKEIALLKDGALIDLPSVLAFDIIERQLPQRCGIISLTLPTVLPEVRSRPLDQSFVSRVPAMWTPSEVEVAPSSNAPQEALAIIAPQQEQPVVRTNVRTSAINNQPRVGIQVRTVPIQKRATIEVSVPE